MLRLVLVAGLVCALLAGGARGATSSFAYDRELGRVAVDSLRRALKETLRDKDRKVLRVYVRCYANRTTFEQAFERRFGGSARRVIGYYIGGGDVHLRAGTCANVRSFVEGRHAMYTAAAFSILLHEALHRQGLENERVTTCYANEAVRWGALRLGFTDEQALRARNLAFTYTRLHSPPSYRMGRPNCLLLARNKSWSAFIDQRRR